MREHPIPQDITGYRFHIIGNLTLKQFVEVAAGVVVAIIFYKLSLPVIIKWPIIITSLAMGVLGAFVPIAGRSFDQWVIIFFKVIYRPTQYFWKKEPTIPDYFTYTPKNPSQVLQPEVDLTPQRRQRVYEYLQSVENTASSTPNNLNTNPDLAGASQTTAVNQTASQAQVKASTPTTQQDLPPTSQPTPPGTDVQTETPAKPTQPYTSSHEAVIFNRNLPFPTTPTTPNKVVGMVLTKDKDLVPNAIVEIYNQAGAVERAVKTNALGQFFITTPLANGDYVLKTTHDKLRFAPVTLKLTGEIVPPLEIVAS